MVVIILFSFCGFGDVLEGDDAVLVAWDACALRGNVHDIDEVGIVFLVDGGREGHATYADVANMSTDDGGTDGTVGGHGVSFDEDDGFHGM